VDPSLVYVFAHQNPVWEPRGLGCWIWPWADFRVGPSLSDPSVVDPLVRGPARDRGLAPPGAAGPVTSRRPAVALGTVATESAVGGEVFTVTPATLLAWHRPGLGRVMVTARPSRIQARVLRADECVLPTWGNVTPE
jgi:hypothetical protein